MALFGNDRSVLPTFRTTPELDSNARSPYDDLNRIERAPERTQERNVERNLERNGRQLDRDARDERSLRDDRRERDERPVERDERRDPPRDERKADRIDDRDEMTIERHAVAKPVQARTKEASAPHPLIAGLFDKLPEPEGEWPLQARLKWLQTAANIFDLMYTAKDADGELAIRLEKNTVR